MSNAPKKKFKLPPVAAVPRLRPEIEQEHANTCARLGVLKYQIYVHEKECEHVQEVLMSLNKEAGARQELDAKKTEEVSSLTDPVVSGNV